jgi:hypothetical protein
VRILTNLPLECFDARAAMRDVELVTYGPPERMLVDGVHFPFDVAFDPSTGDWAQLAARLPPGFVPDVVLLWWPDQEPVPDGLEQCPAQVVGVMSDYNLTLPYVTGLWPFFDLLLCDRQGQELFAALGFAAVRYWCQYAHKRAFHRLWPDAGPRDIEVGFAGNLDPIVQRQRTPWLERLHELGRQGIRTSVRDDVRGEAYGRFLNRCRIGWNRSIRGEMNLRGFEVPACGALLLMERDNREVRDFFVPDEECVLYGDDDLETIVAELLAAPQRLDRIAAAGRQRVEQHRFGNRLEPLRAWQHELPAGTRKPGRPAECALGRATAMLSSWASGPVVVEAARHAHALAPDDPRPLNLLAMAMLRWRGAAAAEVAFRLCLRAVDIDASYVPALHNLTALAAAVGDRDQRRRLQARRELCLEAPTWSQLDGPLLPLDFSALALERSQAMQAARRHAAPELLAAALRQHA